MDEDLIDRNDNCNKNKKQNTVKEKELNNNKNHFIYDDTKSFYPECMLNGEERRKQELIVAVESNGFSKEKEKLTNMHRTCHSNESQDDECDDTRRRHRSESIGDEEISFENVSFHNEGLIEEIILLPNNIISDDEISSNSDDCVYAYRGGIHIENEPEQQAPCADDETDFLEMDFDPEPNSEIENFNENEHFNHLESNFFTLRPSDEIIRELPSVSQLRNGHHSPYDHFNENSHHESNVFEKDFLEKKVTEKVPNEPSFDPIYTGAKPKLVSSSSANRLLDSLLLPDSDLRRPETESNLMKSHNCHKLSQSNDEHITCLECAEIEFIRQTKPELVIETKCNQCSKKFKKKSSPDLASSNPSLSHSTAPHRTEPIKQHLPSSSKTVTKEFMVTIYSVNCDFQTIIEATNLIGVQINPEILRHYFDNLADEETTTMSVPEYLLYISKRNCNYKKLVEIIRQACLEPVDIHFYPVSFLFHIQ